MRGQSRSVTQYARKSYTRLKMHTLSHCAICRSSSVGQRTVVVLLRCQTCTRATRRRARAMSAFTVCRFTTSARPQCTGSFTRSGHAMASGIMSGANGCRLQSPWAAIRSIRSPRPRRCRMVWTNFFLPGSCEKNQSSSSAAKRSTSMYQPMSILSWKVTFSPVKCARRAPLAITPVITPQSKIIRFFI